MKASGIPVSELATLAGAVNGRRQLLLTDTAEHADSARAGLANDKIKEPEKRGRGFGALSETCKRLLIAFGKPGAVELLAARTRRPAQAGEH